MRSAADRKKRRILYRIISVFFLLAGLAKATETMIDLRTGKQGSLFPQMDEALLWLILAATWVAISRVWGELADEAVAREQSSPTALPQ